jgi:hypothetical protein
MKIAVRVRVNPDPISMTIYSMVMLPQRKKFEKTAKTLSFYLLSDFRLAFPAQHRHP